MANTFFLSLKGADVALWCEPRGINANGHRKFWVINGAWSGYFDPLSGEVYTGTGSSKITKSLTANIQWEGQVPPHMGHNEAFLWIKRTHNIPTQFEP